MFKERRPRGFTFIGILLALVIMLILGGQYFKKDEESGKMYAQTQIDKSKISACAINRQVLSTGITSWTIMHSREEVTLEKLRRDRVSVPRCPDGVDYIIGSDTEVYCSIHYPPPTQAKAESQARVPRVEPGSSTGAPAAGTIDRVNRQLGQ